MWPVAVAVKPFRIVETAMQKLETADGFTNGLGALEQLDRLLVGELISGLGVDLVHECVEQVAGTVQVVFLDGRVGLLELGVDGDAHCRQGRRPPAAVIPAKAAERRCKEPPQRPRAV